MEKIVQTFSVYAAIAQYKAVKPTAVDHQCAAATANAVCLGITGAPTTAADEDVPIITLGEAEALLGDTVTLGTHFWLKADANGALVPIGSGAAQNIVAFPLESGVVGDVVRVFVMPYASYPQVAFADVPAEVADPGDAGAIVVTASGHVDLVTTTIGGETRTLAEPTFAGQMMSIGLKTDGGNCVVTVTGCDDGDTITYANTGEAVLLIGIAKGAGFVWRVVADPDSIVTTA